MCQNISAFTDVKQDLDNPHEEDLRKDNMDLKTRLINLESRLGNLAGTLPQPESAASHLKGVEEDNTPTSALEISENPSAVIRNDTTEQLRGVKYVSWTQEPGGLRKEEVHPCPPLLDSQSSTEVDTESKEWLTLVECASQKGDNDLTFKPGSTYNTWRFIIADEQLMNVIEKTFGAYGEHMGRKRGDTRVKVKLQLGGDYNPIVLYWRPFTKLQASMSYEEHGRVYTRLCLLLEYVRKYYPTMTQIQDEWENDPGVEFEDLPVVFVGGTLFVANWFSSDSLVVRKAPQAFKVSSVGIADKDFYVFAWVWDTNGSSSRPIRISYQFKIKPYRYAKPISQLPFYPIDYFKEDGRSGLDAIRCSRHYRSRKDLFQKFTSGTRAADTVLSYEGDVLQSNPTSEDSEDNMPGRELPMDPGMDRLVQIDGEIVVDIKNYVQKRTGPQCLGNRKAMSNPPICSCSLCEDENAKTWLESFKEKARVLVPLNDVIDVNDLLLAPRVFGFALSRKIWCQFELSKIQTVGVPYVPTFRRSLVLPDGVVESDFLEILHMVKYHTHVMGKEPAKHIGDGVKGKGESLILLFHGYSGTGKTLLAETLAKQSGKVLYKVGTSDIGVSGDESAERNLKQIFEFAETWDAVLLNDEADVLLDARGATNEGGLEKNALVSILLREVEYFNGVLIMTTNRITTFDPAVLSRVHHAVNFKELSKPKQADIWDMWLQIMSHKNLCEHAELGIIQDWVRDNWRKLKGGGYSLNGREIRNILIVAQTLAFRHGQDRKITLDIIQRVYENKVDFRQDTEAIHNEGTGLIASKLSRRWC